MDNVVEKTAKTIFVCLIASLLLGVGCAVGTTGSEIGESIITWFMAICFICLTIFAIGSIVIDLILFKLLPKFGWKVKIEPINRKR